MHRIKSWTKSCKSFQNPAQKLPSRTSHQVQLFKVAARLKTFQNDLFHNSLQVPDMVSHVDVLLTELRRLVLLWDELWVAVLQQIHPQVEQLFQKLQSTLQKMTKKGTLTEDNKKRMLHEHCQVLFKPVGDSLS